MIEDVFEGMFRVIGRLIGYFVIEIVFEILLKGTGYFITRLFTKNNPNPEGLLVIFVGAVFWVIVSALAYSIYVNIIAKLLAVM